LVRRPGQLLVDKTADRLAVLEQERDVAAAHFQYRARRRLTAFALAEAGIEEPGVVNAELADRRIDRRHFAGEIGPNLHLLARAENIELVRIENEAPVGAGEDRLPIVMSRVGADPAHVNDVAVLDRAVADDLLPQPPEIDAQDDALLEVERAVHQR